MEHDILAGYNKRRTAKMRWKRPWLTQQEKHIWPVILMAMIPAYLGKWEIFMMLYFWANMEWQTITIGTKLNKLMAKEGLYIDEDDIKEFRGG